jgi:putative ABC transport system permease protein
MHLYAVDPGFSLANVLSLQAPDFSRQTPAHRLQFTRDLVDRVKETSAVQSVAMASSAPLAGSFSARREIRIDNADPDASVAAPQLVTRVVSSGYFDTVGTRVIAGRAFAATDTGTAPQVAIISDSMARFYFKSESPIGRRISLRLFNGNWSQPIEIVGVAADSRADGIDREPMHTLYQPDSQIGAQSTLLVRTTGAADALAPQVVETIRGLDPNRPIDHVRTLEEIRDETIAPQRLNATLIGLFSALALIIATVGIAGVLAFSVSQRTNELGIRLALGAERGAIQRMILAEGAVMVAIGLLIGGVAAIPFSQVISGLLFGIQPVDPPTILAAAGIMIAVALAAAWIPARRATAVDPIVALRGD